MYKLLRYLKPFAGSVILIFLLLFAQAMTDLELPAYMSRIVNVGLQQSGIEKPLPEAMRLQQFSALELVLDDSSWQLIDAAYIIHDLDSLPDQDSEQLRQKYPLLQSESLAVLGDIDADQRSFLIDAVSRGLVILGSIEYMLADLPDLPDDLSAADLLAMLPEEQLQVLLVQAAQALEIMPQSMIEQTAIGIIIEEYEQIGIDLSGLENRYLLRTGGLMLLIALLGAFCSILVGLISARVAAGLGRDLRLSLFSKVENFSGMEFDTFSTASLITRSTNDIQQIQMMLVMLLRILFYAPILGIGGVLKVIESNVSMTWIIALAVAVLMTLILAMFSIAMPRFKKIQKMVDRVNLVMREILSGLMVIRAFNTEEQQEKKFDQANRDLTRTNLFVSRLMALLMPVMMLIMNGITLLIIWVGAVHVDRGTMQVGDVMAFMQYAIQIIMAFLMVSMIFIMLPRASVSAQRINEVLVVQPQIADPPDPVAFAPEDPGRVEMRNVTFRYPNAEADVLHDISFTAEPGQTTAIIGSTGCGKSTLVNLLPRFYDVTAGQILIDNKDVRSVCQEDLRRRIGYVPQKGVLFSGDIAENIRYGKEDASTEEIRLAAEVAQALDFIESSEDGFAASVAQGGSNVSGGQRQRLSIARALAGNPPIYIFDDSFSALDFRTDAALRRALKKYTGNATVIIVAQRIGTIRNAEQILVLEEGRIVGRGSHRELLDTCSVYREIAASQLSEEELDI